MLSKSIKLLLVLTHLLASALCYAQNGCTPYTITAIPPVAETGGCCTRIDAVNNRGQAVGFTGSSNDDWEGFRFPAYFYIGQSRLIPSNSFEFISHTAVAINDDGAIAISEREGIRPPEAYVIDAANNVTDLGLSELGAREVYATNINQSGHVVGYFHTPSSDQADIAGFLYSNNTLSVLDFGYQVYVEDINNQDQLIGNYSPTMDDGLVPFLYQDGVIQDLLPGSTVSGRANAMNDFGEIVGSSEGNAVYFRDDDVVLIAPSESAIDINNGGTVLLRDKIYRKGQICDLGHNIRDPYGQLTTIRAEAISDTEVIAAGPFMFGPCGEGDLDMDGIADQLDNCQYVHNPIQEDTDFDNNGNACDGDLNNDGTTNFADLAEMKAAFYSSDPHADISGDGIVNFVDLGRMKQMFFQPPGPSCPAALSQVVQ